MLDRYNADLPRPAVRVDEEKRPQQDRTLGSGLPNLEAALSGYTASLPSDHSQKLTAPSMSSRGWFDPSH